LPGYAVKPVSNKFPHISRRIQSVASWCSRQALSSPEYDTAGEFGGGFIHRL
jgi:hypothetical protein